MNVKDRGRGSAIVFAAVWLIILPSGLEGAPTPSICKNLPGVRAELRRTPRADTQLELLALALSDGITADQAIYERLLRDLTFIRRMEARVKSVEYRSRHDGKTLLLRFSETAGALFADRKYHLWDCVNRHFGFESAQAIAPDLVEVRLKGIYDLEKVASVYARLPGVLNAKPAEAASPDDGATILVTREEDVWHYVFRTQRASAFHYFVTRGGESPEHGGVWTGRASTSPAWLRRYWFSAEPR